MDERSEGGEVIAGRSRSFSHFSVREGRLTPSPHEDGLRVEEVYIGKSLH